MTFSSILPLLTPPLSKVSRYSFDFSTLFVAMATVWFVGISLAHADGDRLRRVEFARHRPANFYELVFSQDPAVCKPLLKSLNQEYLQSTPADSVAILHNRYLVNKWKHGKYDFKIRIGNYDKVAEGWWEVAVLDLNKDGNKDGIFRHLGSLSGWPVHYLYVESPTKPDVIAGQKLSLKRRKEILGIKGQRSAVFSNEVRLSSRYMKQNVSKYLDDTWPAYFDIIEVRNHPYILTANAFYWTLKRHPRSLKVSVLEYKNPANFRMICQFKGKQRIYME